MPVNSSTSALALAGTLRNFSDEQLAALLTAREIRETGIRDFFDLAEAMLDPAALQRALGRLDRPTLASVSVLSVPMTRADAAAALEAAGASSALLDQHIAVATSLALVVEADGLLAAYDAVAAQLRSWPSLGLPSFDELLSVPPPATLGPVSAVDTRFTDHVAAERAFATTSAVAELVAEVSREPARELAKGGIALPDTKRIATAMSVELDEVAVLQPIAVRAGLLALDSGQWMATGDTAGWVVGSWGERWAALAGAWLDRLPPDIRQLLAARSHAVWGERLEEFVNWLFPAGGEWMRDRMRVYTRDAELLGITASHSPSTPGATLLADGQGAAAAEMAALFPAEVHQVYLQHDLSVVSPGPLATALDVRLRTMADAEGRALASTYRISGASLNRALASGETDESVRAFLAGISLTGVPQPLEYLITETASRFGLLRVGALDGAAAAPGSIEYGARSYVRSEDGELLGTLVVDHGLSPLGLTRVGPHRVVSRFDRDLVFWSLSDARYPAAAEDSAETVVVLRRRSTIRPSAVAAVDPTRSLIEKLRLGSSNGEQSNDEAWLSRQLDLAIRNKVALTVTVTMPNGSTVDYQLEPASVAGGRLRARDRKADIERTLPLSSIAGVAPAD
ncbi:MAG: helicase-associated domain-containing protein [Rhodoglobus sp.]